MNSPKSEEDMVSTEDIIKRAMQYPGVSDLMKIFQEYDEIVRVTHEYFSVAREQFTFSVTGSTE